MMAPSRGFRIVHRHCRDYRLFTTNHSNKSGHNRWSKIKHDKGKKDAAKHRERSVFSQEIYTASKLGGPDPSLNSRLADLISKAKREGFAKSSIEAAISRGQGRSTTGASLESVTVEGILPNNIAVIVDAETDSRLRTLAEVRGAMKAAGGSSSPCAYLFKRRGCVNFESKHGIGIDEVLEPALEAGATDIEEGHQGRVVVFCEPTDTTAIAEAVGNALGLVVRTSEIVWSPNDDTRVALASETVADELGAFVDNLLDRETTVQAISMNVSQGGIGEGPWKELQSRLSV
jgi:YebC/PmpR family DNA-binding regulatory protein